MKTSAELVQDCKQIEKALLLSGKQEAAQKLENIRLAGSTGGEIIMGIRFTANLILKSETLGKNISDSLHQLIDDINGTGW